jgi:hypothetical protein
MIHQFVINQERMKQLRKGNNHNHNYQGGIVKDVDTLNVDGMNLNTAKIHPQEHKWQYNEGYYFNYS